MDTLRAGSWSAARHKLNSTVSSADHDIYSTLRKHQTPDRRRQGKRQSQVRWQPVELSNQSLSVEGRGQQDVITAFHAFKRKQNDKA